MAAYQGGSKISPTILRGRIRKVWKRDVSCAFLVSGYTVILVCFSPYGGHSAIMRGTALQVREVLLYGYLAWARGLFTAVFAISIRVRGQEKSHGSVLYFRPIFCVVTVFSYTSNLFSDDEDAINGSDDGVHMLYVLISVMSCIKI